MSERGKEFRDISEPVAAHFVRIETLLERHNRLISDATKAFGHISATLEKINDQLFRIAKTLENDIIEERETMPLRDDTR